MKTKSVRYEKCFNLGNYEHEKIAVEVEVEEKDSVKEVIQQARNYVTMQSKPFQDKYEQAQEVVNNPDDHTGRAVKSAKDFIANVSKMLVPSLSNMSESRE